MGDDQRPQLPPSPIDEPEDHTRRQDDQGANGTEIHVQARPQQGPGQNRRPQAEPMERADHVAGLKHLLKHGIGNRIQDDERQRGSSGHRQGGSSRRGEAQRRRIMVRQHRDHGCSPVKQHTHHGQPPRDSDPKSIGRPTADQADPEYRGKRHGFGEQQDDQGMIIKMHGTRIHVQQGPDHDQNILHQRKSERDQEHEAKLRWRRKIANDRSHAAKRLTELRATCRTGWRKVSPSGLLAILNAGGPPELRPGPACGQRRLIGRSLSFAGGENVKAG